MKEFTFCSPGYRTYLEENSLEKGEKEFLESIVRNRTKVFIEVHHDFLAKLGHSVHDIVGFLKGFGYSVSSVTLSNLHQSNEYEGCEYLYAHR